MIEEYHFGFIKIDGKSYTHDVEVRWVLPKDKQLGGEIEVLPWWREEGHVIDVKDIKSALEQNPDLIIIGTGASGIARVTERAEKEIVAQDIELLIASTEEAVQLFNDTKKTAHQRQGIKKIIGLFHLTC